VEPGSEEAEAAAAAAAAAAASATAARAAAPGESLPLPPPHAHTGVSHRPGAPPAGVVVLPPNVFRVVNWAHVSALLSRLRAIPVPPAAPSAAADGLPPAAAAAAQRRGQAPLPQQQQRAEHARWEYSAHTTTVTPAGGVAVEVPVLARRDTVTVHSRPLPHQAAAGYDGAAATARRPAAFNAAYFHESVLRSFELGPVVALTGTGDDVRLVADVVGAVVRAGEGVVAGTRTGADAAAPGAARGRPPRLTVNLVRAPGFLARRFGAGGGGGAHGGHAPRLLPVRHPVRLHV
jgi:hypothetical protein